MRKKLLSPSPQVVSLDQSGNQQKPAVREGQQGRKGLSDPRPTKAGQRGPALGQPPPQS